MVRRCPIPQNDRAGLLLTEIELIKNLTSYSKKITIKEIELCLKIDKTYPFKQLTTKEKKRIIKQFKV